MTDKEVEDIIRSNMNLQMNLAGIRQDFEGKLQRTWVGLTDEELHALHFELKVQTMGGINTLGMYRILEKALREKNG